MLIFVWNWWHSVVQGHGAPAGDNPWNGWTLEWATTSSPPVYNFATLPLTRSARPLWDLAHPCQQLARGPARGGMGHALTRPRTVGRSMRRTGGLFEGLEAPVLGTIVLVASEVVFFGALLVAYILYRTGSAGAGPADLDVSRTVLFSLALFASSGTLILAERRLRKEDQRGFVLWLLTTVVLALVFLLGQVTEYAHLYGAGITIGTNLFTSSFFTLTGFHSLHVTIGMLLLALFAVLGARGNFRVHRRRAAVDAISVYWHFVDAVWVVLLSVVYLCNLVG